MPMPWTYRHASAEWSAMLVDLRDRMGLASDNMAYTAFDGVLQVFRRRLRAREGLDFASVLPAVPRAIFVAGWIPEAAPPPFAERAALVREVQAVRRDHNLAPDHVIEAAAWCLRRRVDPRAFERVLARLPEGAAAFWHVDVDDPGELAPRFP
ncbi:DUF2267 domain-containing protein [Jannaschia sp. W003]|uniref:DUF2267 domain-containing protein n=1 Tax=Jannaschia sp. W003 TaxID=2867012 RepID=UPI0021A7F94D|nr:DUF2267 domain-containing protein [Jannaschia sp. W003]UWQ21690.1 DUF2267 domain-containing protein [Jannaschia sp. W003]